MDVSRICLGCMSFGDAERWVHKWVLDEENSRPIIKKALELGINFFDTANVYSIGKSEEILGRALRDFADRDEVVIASKLKRWRWWSSCCSMVVLGSSEASRLLDRLLRRVDRGLGRRLRRRTTRGLGQIRAAYRNRTDDLRITRTMSNLPTAVDICRI